MLPKEVKVFGKIYQVIESKEPFTADDEACGMMKYEQQKIFVRPDIAQESKEETLLHEVIHCVEMALKMDLPEQIIHALGEGLYAVLRDNDIWWDTGDDE